MEVRAQEVIVLIDGLLKDLASIIQDVQSDGDTNTARARLDRWKSRTIADLKDRIGDAEADEFNKSTKWMGASYVDIVKNRVDESKRYEAHLVSLKKELEARPEYVFTQDGEENEIDSEVLKRSQALPEPVQLLDGLQLHSAVVNASRQLFVNGHYSLAIFEAFKTMNNKVKAVSALDKDGKDLMSKAFGGDSPKIRLNELKTQSDRNEQQGLMLIYMGAMEGIRNPKAHESVDQTDPYKTIEYLSLASLLLKWLDDRR